MIVMMLLSVARSSDDSDHSILQMIKEIKSCAKGENCDIQSSTTDDNWKELGHDISNNTHLETSDNEE